MFISYFAHNGVDHHSATEATIHNESAAWPVILAVTVVIGLAVFIGLKFLAKSGNPKDKE